MRKPLTRELSRALLIRDYAKKEWERVRRLAGTGTTSDQELEDAELKLKLAEVDVKFLSQE